MTSIILFMKRIITIITFLLCLTVSSCTFFDWSGNTLSVTVPDNILENEAREIFPRGPENERYQVEMFEFEITLTDSSGAQVIKKASAGDTVVFENVPKGPANVSIIFYRKDNDVCFLCGNNSTNVSSGENSIEVTLFSPKINMTGPNGEDLGEQSIEGIMFGTGLIYENVNIPKLMDVASWFDEDGKEWDLKKSSELVSYLKQIRSDSTLTANFGVPLNNLDRYLSSLTFSDKNKTIVFMDDGTTTTIPDLTEITIRAENLTLDFSRTKITDINENAFTNSTMKNIANLYLPSSIKNINGLKSVGGNIYIPLLDRYVSFGNNIGDSNSTYTIHYNGTVTAWCKDFSFNSTESNPMRWANAIYVLENQDGTNEVNIKSGNIRIEQEYYNFYAKDSVPDYAYAYVPLNSITINSSIHTIGKQAFLYCGAKEIYLGKNVGPFNYGSFYDSVARNIYYDGTLDNWMSVEIPASSLDIKENGGPFTNGKTNLYVLNENGTSVKVSGAIEISMKYSGTTSTYYIEGQLQGLKGITEITVKDPYGPQVGISYRDKIKYISNYAFMNCSDLTKIKVYPRVNLAKDFIKNTKVSDIYLYYWSDADHICTISYTKNSQNNTFGEGITKPVTIHVPQAALSAYQNYKSWKDCVSDGYITIKGDL